MSAVEKEVKEKQRYATLVRGTSYYLGNKKFAKGVSVPVSAKEEDILRKEAVDKVTVEGGAEDRQKFRFSDSPLKAEEVVAQTRVRRRAPDADRE